jgi:thioredoxin 1
MPPILKQVKDAVKDDATILKIDVDKSPQAAQQFQVQGVPTLILFKNGKPVWRQSGVVQSKTIIEQINQSLK